MTEVSLSVPFEIDAYGRVASATSQEKIWADRVLSVIGTTQKERLLNPNIGTNVPANIFNNSEDAKVEMETEIRLAFAKQLPLLRLIDLIISTDNFTNQATIEISYSLPNRQQTSLTIGFVYIEGNNPPYQEIL